MRKNRINQIVVGCALSSAFLLLGACDSRDASNFMYGGGDGQQGAHHVGGGAAHGYRQRLLAVSESMRILSQQGIIPNGGVVPDAPGEAAQGGEMAVPEGMKTLWKWLGEYCNNQPVNILEAQLEHALNLLEGIISSQDPLQEYAACEYALMLIGNQIASQNW